MEKTCRFSYSEMDDSLIVSCKEENENVKDNFMFDNFIFSLTGKGKIVALRVLNASKVLTENNISPGLLKELKSISLVTIQKQNCLFIALSITSQNAKASIPLRVFIPEISAA